MGRLFDAAAALIGINHRSSYEGLAPMMLEALAARLAPGEPLALPLAPDRSARVLRTDWQPLLAPLMEQTHPPEERAALFHDTLAHALVAQAKAVRERYGEFTVGLAGGVFQNRRLTEQVLALAAREGFAVRLGEQLPANDAAICFGQIIAAAAPA